jgi:membrane protease YdiL (CAAX protease family)
VAATPSASNRLSIATYVGLFVALVVPFLSYAVGRLIFGVAQSDARIVLGLVMHWVTLAGLVAVIVFWERLPLASVGLRPIRWWTIPAGLLAGVAITLLSSALVSALRFGSDAHYAAYLQSLPFILRLALVVTAGIFEEVLYRGYAFERLTTIWRSQWTAAVVTVALFILAHLPVIGFAHLPAVAVVSVLVTLLYLWRRDLILNMVAHATIDGIALLVVPIALHSHR